MITDLNKQNKNIFLFFLIGSFIIFETTVFTFFEYREAFNVSFGLSLGYFLLYDFDAFPGIVLANFITKYFTYAIVFQVGFVYAMPFSLLYTAMVVASIITIRTIFVKFDILFPGNIVNTIIYVLTIGVIIMIFSIPLMILTNNYYNFEMLSSLQSIDEGAILGAIICGTLITFSEKYDQKTNFYDFKLSYIIYYMVMVIIFVFSIHYSVSNNIFIYLAPIILLIFIPHSFYFNYRYLFFSTMTFVTIYALELKINTNNDYGNVSSILNLLLFTIITVTIVIKALFDDITLSRKELEESNESKEEIMNAIFSLFKVHNINPIDDFSYNENYMKNVFNMTSTLFPKVSHMIGVITLYDDILYIDSKGYTKEEIESWGLSKEEIIWDYSHPIYDKNPNDYYYKKSKNYTNSLQYNNSVRFVIPLGNNEFGAITLDATGDYTITKNDYANISYLQRLLITFYDKNELLLKTNSLKDDMVLSLIRTLEFFDQYTGGHSEDVAVFSKMIAEKLSLSEEEIYDVYWAGIVHDIGKIGISPEIINKPSKLTLEEYEEIKKHPLYGYSILKRSKELNTIALVVKHHHEWYNGSGYPDKLSKDQIPFLSQILTVADSVSSMATRRPYQKKKETNEIIKELKMYKGIQFNPEIADIMIDLLESGVIDEYYKEESANEEFDKLLF